ncbi:hypothetical protein C9374_006476 [Naegleria lovaniensis]|uniref:Uncharacterized protein n=1 Tax=Naegleria lovaniensis TaxID=51637 RepID=A0AA88GNK1_NAELO|nr:uncharacterized protein C9374_006476 [Naegleria lovaniensis]KAG2381487.1 hypothetical protein C9374_006476 [Naegleria lovaniensis]
MEHSYSSATPSTMMPSTKPFQAQTSQNPFVIENKKREEKYKPIVMYKCGACGMESNKFLACASCQSKLMYKKRTPRFIHHDTN